jgi:cyclopropane fatty-acyl-phospholipid synthase-like methyltransferase
VRYDPSFYDGAAVHYRYGRPAYSARLEALLAEELGLDGSGRLLDVGCGPGILTVRLARLFEGAVGLDPDPAMIAEGRRAAQERDIANITWIQARAEDLPAVAPGPYRRPATIAASAAHGGRARRPLLRCARPVRHDQPP